MQIAILLIFGFALSALVGMVIIPRILVISHKKKLYDLPDDRKVHNHPIPRLGGLSFFPTVQISFLFCIGLRLLWVGQDSPTLDFSMLYQFIFLVIGLTLLYITGAGDDLVGVGYRYKFIVQIISASLFTLSGNCLTSLGGFFGIYDLSPIVSILFTILLVVYVTNAINLIDGIDGLASGLCSITFIVIAIFFYAQNDFIYALLSLCVLGVLIPFWMYNVFGNETRGRKLFMGDAGSLTLGYVISFLLIHLCERNNVSGIEENPFLMIAFSTVLVPLLDVIRVVIHRIRNKKNPFLPDKNHFHHKLLRTGMGVRMVMTFILFISVSFILLNMVLISLEFHNTCIFWIDVVLWTIMHLILNRIIIKKEQGTTV